MTPTRRSTPSRLLPAIAVVLLAVAACGASAASPAPSRNGPEPQPPGSPGAPSSLLPGGLTPGPANPTPVPGGPTDPGNAGSGGSVPGNPGTGIEPNPPGADGTVPGDPINVQPRITTPTAGLVDLHAVGAANLLATVDGRDVTVRVSWWSGVEPCNVLASVDVARDGSTITLTVREGDTGQLIACDDLALYKGTFVDLGQLDPGSYTIKAFGDAPAIQVVVTG
jgi:hypothetical protein